MSTKQYFIYDSDGGGFVSNGQVFTVTSNSPLLIRAAGLTEDVIIYEMVGECRQCKPSDVIWVPLQECGVPVVLNETNSREWVYLEGTYSIGDPNNPPVLAGDVNITAQMYRGVDPSLLKKPECSNPMVPIETTMAELGCIVDADGQIIGKIMLTKTVNENDGSETVSQTAYYEDGTTVFDYSGPWQVCAPDQCVGETPMGVITDINLLK